MNDLLDRTPPAADHRVAYGEDEFQFGDLWLPLPRAADLSPVLVFLHGGWWKAAYGLEYGGHLCADLKARGVACWSLEYRRVGHSGGGWPGTFEDVARGFDFLSTLATLYPLDLKKIVVAGHSAGGQLAFWLAGRPQIPEGSVLRNPQPNLAAKGVVALAGAVDLRHLLHLAQGIFEHDRQEIVNLMGGLPAEVPERYAAGDPGQLCPLRVPQYLIQGTEDDQIPAAMPQQWAEQGCARGESVHLELIPGSDHFDVVDPESQAWPVVRRTILAALG